MQLIVSKCAALTIAHNEPDFLRMWYTYYSQHFADSDLYILDNESEPEYIDGILGNFDHIGTGRGYDGDTHLRVSLTNKFVELLGSYEYVLCHDVDMFVVPDPEKYPGGLSEYIEQFTDTFAQCSGYNVVDTVGESLDVNNRPWLMQRQYWHREWKHLCKVVLAREDPKWGGGCHQSKWTPGYQEEIGKFEREDLRLLHFGWICGELVRRRWAARVAVRSYANHWDPDKAHRTVKKIGKGSFFVKEEIPNKWRMAL